VAKKPKGEVRYEIEGYYPVGHVAALLRMDPSDWQRDWKMWHWTTDLREARQTMRAGNYLRHRTCPLSYTMLRIVQVTTQGRKIVK
jgi:hypothetical protein